MNGSTQQIEGYTATLQSLLANEPCPHSLWIAPPFLYMAQLVQALKNTAVEVGGQNCHSAEKGAFTGEISAKMLKDCGASFVIVGHSERRALGETNEMIQQKVSSSHQAGLKVVLCIGESFEEKQKGQGKEKLSSQLRNSLSESSSPCNTLIAYEPIWSIGTGLLPTSVEINDVVEGLRATLPSSLVNLPIIYGGSVTAKNIQSILQETGIEGVLVGGASLEVESFWQLIKNCP